MLTSVSKDACNAGSHSFDTLRSPSPNEESLYLKCDIKMADQQFGSNSEALHQHGPLAWNIFTLYRALGFMLLHRFRLHPLVFYFTISGVQICRLSLMNYLHLRLSTICTTCIYFTKCTSTFIYLFFTNLLLPQKCQAMV